MVFSTLSFIKNKRGSLRSRKNLIVFALQFVQKHSQRRIQSQIFFPIAKPSKSQQNSQVYKIPRQLFKGDFSFLHYPSEHNKQTRNILEQRRCQGEKRNQSLGVTQVVRSKNVSSLTFVNFPTFLLTFNGFFPFPGAKNYTRRKIAENSSTWGD